MLGGGVKCRTNDKLAYGLLKRTVWHLMALLNQSVYSTQKGPNEVESLLEWGIEADIQEPAVSIQST